MTDQITLTEEQQAEYESYISNYDAYYDDGIHLDPVAYFEAMAEIKAILAEYDKAYQAKIDFAELDKKYDARLRQLERMLAV